MSDDDFDPDWQPKFVTKKIESRKKELLVDECCECDFHEEVSDRGPCYYCLRQPTSSGKKSFTPPELRVYAMLHPGQKFEHPELGQRVTYAESEIYSELVQIFPPTESNTAKKYTLELLDRVPHIIGRVPPLATLAANVVSNSSKSPASWVSWDTGAFEASSFDASAFDALDASKSLVSK